MTRRLGLRHCLHPSIAHPTLNTTTNNHHHHHHPSFVTFGVVYGLLRRVHRYPVFLRGTTAPSTHTTITAALTQAGLLATPAASVAGASTGAGGGIVFPPSRSSSLSKSAVGASSSSSQQSSQQQQQQQQGTDMDAVASALLAQQQQQQQQMLQPAPMSAQLVLQIQAVMDGTMTTDALCVAFLRPYSELEELALVGGGEGAEVCILYK
jgi:hypothetical protein